MKFQLRRIKEDEKNNVNTDNTFYKIKYSFSHGTPGKRRREFPAGWRIQQHAAFYPAIVRNMVLFTDTPPAKERERKKEHAE